MKKSTGRKVKVKLPNGEIIKRKAYHKKLGNFVNMYIRYNNEYYWIGDGDEYIRGGKEVYALGKKIPEGVI